MSWFSQSPAPKPAKPAMQNFYGSLTDLRTNGPGAITSETRRAASAAVSGGHKVANLEEAAAWCSTTFPPTRHYSHSMAEGRTPQLYVAFVISTTGSWELTDQHSLYYVWGTVGLRNLMAARESLSSTVFRDHSAGFLQHLANGLSNAAKAARPGELLRLPLPEPHTLTPLEAAKLAVKQQFRAAALRAEKYGADGSTYETAVHSYTAALTVLVSCLRIQASLEEPGAARVALEDAAAGVETTLAALQSRATKVYAHLSSNERLPAAVQRELGRDQNIAEIALSRVQAGVPSGPDSEESPSDAEDGVFVESAICLSCSSAQATHRGVFCNCLALCENCLMDLTERKPTRRIECPNTDCRVLTLFLPL